MLRRMLTLLSVTLLFSTLPGQIVDARADSRTAALTVMTFNIHHAAGTDEVLDLGRIADVIRSSGADVVALQEVDNHWSERSDWADQTAELADLLGFQHAYGANLDLDPAPGRDERSQYGTAILSRFPITSAENTLLPQEPDTEQRGLLHAEIDVRGVPVHAYSTHLEHTSQAARLAQTERIVELVGDSAPAVIMGDLNALPGSPELAPFDASYLDAWRQAGHGSAATYPADAPTKRIDDIFVSPDVRVVRARVVDETPEASDHLPVASRILIRS